MTKKPSQETKMLESIYALIDFEKACAKTYLKFLKYAQTPEVAKALDPEQTNILNHIDRLKIIKKLVPLKLADPIHISPITPIPLKKNKNLEQDIVILNKVLALQKEKIASYQHLLELVQNTLAEPAPEMVNQCILENQQTSTWLARTLSQLN